MKRILFPLVLVGVATMPASAQIQLSLLANVGITMPGGIQPSAVAWDGTNAWVGAYNNSGATANTFITPIANVLTAPTQGADFGIFSTANGRGLSSLSVNSSGTVLSSLDNGAGSGSSIRAFSGGSEIWNIGTGGADAAKRGNGTAFDPGFNGTGSNAGGAAFLAIGSGRRFVLNPTTGAYINGALGGSDAIINFSPTSTTWRDMAFDPATGDLYTRETNRIGKATRTGNNAFSASTTLVTPVGSTSFDNQNIAFINATSTGNFLLVNDRASATSGQQLGNILKAYTTTGTAMTLAFTGINPVTTTGVGAYDFSYDAKTNTLAVSDFSNKRLYVFSVASSASAAPEPGTLALGALGLVALLARRRRA
jgi:MYXO-CTERM domain-containing protein